jgi:hypothetical protein
MQLKNNEELCKKIKAWSKQDVEVMTLRARVGHRRQRSAVSRPSSEPSAR